MTIDLSAWAILLVVGICALLEDSIGLGIILPAETVVLAASAAAAAGAVNVWAVFAVAVAFGVAGDCGGFWVGRRFGGRFLERFGPALHVTPERIARANDAVARWGVLGVAVGRFVPALRILVMPAAGMAGMPFAVFFVGDLVGVTGWASLHVAIGYLLGFGLEKNAGVGPVAGVAAIVATVAFGLLVYHRRRRRVRSTGLSPSARE